MLRSRVGIRAEVAHTLKLICRADRCIFQCRLQVALRNNQRLRIEVILPRGLSLRSVVWVLGLEQWVVKADFCLNSMLCRHPMDNALHTATITRRAFARHRVVRAAQLNNIALLVLDNLIALDKVRVAQAHLVTRRKAEVFLWRILHKVVTLDVDNLREWNLTHTCLFVLRVIDSLTHLDLALLPICDNHFERVQYCHSTLGNLIQVLTHAVLHLAEVNNIIALCHAHHLGKCSHRCRSIALTAQCADSRHSRVVPTRHCTLLNKLQKVTLRHHRIGQIQTSKLVLMRWIDLQSLDKPIVQWAVNIELQSTNRVSDILNRVALTVCVVVHRVDAPLVACAVVLGVQNTVHNRVTEEHIRVRHINLCTQHLLAIGKLAGTHTLEQVQVLLYRTVTPRRWLSGLGNSTTIQSNLLLCLVINIRQALLDKDNRPLVELVEVVRSVTLDSPIETEPLNIALNRIYILGILLYGVGIVKAKITLTAILLRQTEVYADTLCVSDVKVAIWLWWKSCLHVRQSIRNRLLDNLFKEVQRLLLDFNILSCHNFQFLLFCFSVFLLFCSPTLITAQPF